MNSINVLGHDIVVEFFEGTGATIKMDEAQLMTDLGWMTQLINDKQPWQDEYEKAFKIMKKIVFFEGVVMVNGYPMDRPCVDQDDAIFYWESSEFNKYNDADVHASYYFHDCWHVVQFNRDGYPSKDEEVEREVDAISHQVIVAEQLGCSDSEIAHLKNYAGDPAAIEKRLKEGVKFQVPHKPGAFGRTD